MNGRSQNNPYAIGALMLVLGAAVVYTFRQMRGDGAPETTVTPAAQAFAAPAAAPPRILDALRRGVGRDPFFHPKVTRAAGGGALPPMGPPQSPRAPVQLGGIGPALVEPPSMGGLGTRSPQAARPGSTAPASGAANGARPEPPPVPPGLRVTAIVGGRARTAVVEGTGPVPVSVREGDRIGDLRVDAVNARDVVLAGPRGLVTVAVEAEEHADHGVGAPKENTDAGR